MAGEPNLKFAKLDPRPPFAGRDLRAVAAAKAAASDPAKTDLRARGERRGIERSRIEKVGGFQQSLDEPAAEQSFSCPAKLAA